MKRLLICLLLVFCVGCASTDGVVVEPTVARLVAVVATSTVTVVPSTALPTAVAVVVETVAVVEALPTPIPETKTPIPTNTAIPPTETATVAPTNTPAPVVNYIEQAGQFANGGFYRGNPNAPVTVLDYSDFL